VILFPAGEIRGAVERTQPRICSFGHHHTRLDGQLAGAPRVGLNKGQYGGGLVAVERFVVTPHILRTAPATCSRYASLPVPVAICGRAGFKGACRDTVVANATVFGVREFRMSWRRRNSWAIAATESPHFRSEVQPRSRYLPRSRHRATPVADTADGPTSWSTGLFGLGGPQLCPRRLCWRSPQIALRSWSVRCPRGCCGGLWAGAQ
jgi:hypothetical protein